MKSTGRNNNVLVAVLAYSVIALHSSLVSAQQHKIDSLKAALKTEKDDTNKVKTLNKLAGSFYTVKPDSTILLAQQASTLAVKLGWKKGEAIAYNNAGLGYYSQGNYPKATEYHLKALKIAEERGDKQLQAMQFGNIGIVCQDQGDYSKALDYYLKALKVDDELGDKQGQACDYGSIGSVYENQGDYPKALDYYLKTLKMAEEMGDKQLQAKDLSSTGLVYTEISDYPKALDYHTKALKMAEQIGNKILQAGELGNIGIVYQSQGDYHKALEYQLKSLKIDEELGDKQDEANQLNNIGDTYYSLGDYTKSLECQLNALKMAEEIGNKQFQAVDLSNIGQLYTKAGKFKEAEEYLKKAITLLGEIGDQNTLMQSDVFLSDLYDTTGRYNLALAYYKKAMVLKDTLFNMDKNKALTRKEMTYEFEKKQAEEKAEQDKKDALAEADKRKQRIITWAVAGGLLLVLVFAGFILRSLNITRKQKNLIEQQKTEVEQQKALVEEKSKIVEEKNKDILDSITYAKRLQDAILPPLSLMKQYLPESFLLYKPKDIVAGDFYWMERAGDTILIAAADCTGHGVPGAMVSVVCSNALNRTVKEFKITEPGKILDKVRELVLETFEKSQDNVQDGMDISLCCINTKTNEVQWSGAYNSLWYIPSPKGEGQGEVIEVAADKQPIGKVDKPVPFNTHNLSIPKDSILYLFTDGYADQFGGPKGKKFKYKQLQQLLMDNCKLSMEEQKRILDKSFEEWKGNLEQTDDVCIIGIRV